MRPPPMAFAGGPPPNQVHAPLHMPYMAHPGGMLAPAYAPVLHAQHQSRPPQAAPRAAPPNGLFQQIAGALPAPGFVSNAGVGWTHPPGSH